MRSFKGGVIVRAYLTESGEEVTAVDKTAVTANADAIAGSREALRAAGELAGEGVAAQVAAAWQKRGLAAGKVRRSMIGVQLSPSEDRRPRRTLPWRKAMSRSPPTVVSFTAESMG